MAKDFIAPDFDGDDLRIGLVQARFNEWAGRALAEACMNELITLGVDEDDITHITVPGSLEIPLALAKLAATDDFDALIALGCVIRGDTYHFEVVANESARGRRECCARIRRSDRQRHFDDRYRRAGARARRPKKDATQRAWRSKWPTCCGRWTKTAPPLPTSEE